MRRFGEGTSGEDAILEPGENDRVNVTHISTARYLLAKDQNGGKAPAVLAELISAEPKIDPDQLLNIAAIIKLLADDIDYTYDWNGAFVFPQLNIFTKRDIDIIGISVK